MTPPEFVHTRSPGLSNAQLSVLRHTAVESHPEAALRGQGACSCAQSCTQEQRDVCAKHHTVSMALHAPTLPAHSSNGHGRSACTHRAHRQRTGAYPSAASHDAALLAGLVDVGAHEGQARARRRRASKNRRASRHADGQRPCRDGRRFAAPVRARAPACPSRRASVVPTERTP